MRAVAFSLETVDNDADHKESGEGQARRPTGNLPLTARCQSLHDGKRISKPYGLSSWRWESYFFSFMVLWMKERTNHACLSKRLPLPL